MLGRGASDSSETGHCWVVSAIDHQHLHRTELFEDALTPPVLEMIKQIERSILLQWSNLVSKVNSVQRGKQAIRHAVAKPRVTRSYLG